MASRPRELSTFRPSFNLLVPLQEAANRGDILALRRELATLRSTAPAHPAFILKLEPLATSYQMGAIRQRFAVLTDSV